MMLVELHELGSDAVANGIVKHFIDMMWILLTLLSFSPVCMRVCVQGICISFQRSSLILVHLSQKEHSIDLCF